MRRGQLCEEWARSITDAGLAGSMTEEEVLEEATSVYDNPALDSDVASHMTSTAEASRLLGATVIVSGLSPEIAQDLVRSGVDLDGDQYGG